MVKKSILIYLLVEFLCIHQHRAQEVPKNGVSIFNSNVTLLLTPSVSENDLKLTRINSKEIDKNEIIRLSTLTIAKNIWDYQINAKTESPVQVNDIILLMFWGRMIETKDETGQSTMMCTFEKSGGDYRKTLYRVVNFDSEWRQYFIPFKMDYGYGIGEAQFNFQVGTSKQQTIELADIQLLNFKKSLKLEELPQTKYSYPGRELEAAWRKVAEENINKYRKSEVVLQMRDKKGNIMPNVTVSIEMKKHEFGWGTAIDAHTFLTNEKYRTTFYKNFNKAVFENDLKWPEWNIESNRKIVFSVLDSLQKRNIPARGHCLVWPGWRWLPGYLKKEEKDTANLKKQILDHIEEETTVLKNKLTEWDVLNEPYTNTDITDLCGEQVMIDWFTKTKKIDSKAVLYINDFSILSGGGNDLAHQDHYYKTIKFLKDNNAPVEGIGFQSHFSWSLTSPEKIWKILDRYSDFGLDLQVTEFDIDIDEEQLQADYTRDFMTAIFSYPSMKGMMIWGFWEGKHWKPTAAMYRKDWSEKPSLSVWNDLIYKTWWTSEIGLTDEKGIFKTNAFHGDYIFSVKNEKGKLISSGSFSLTSGGKVYNFRLD